QAEDGIRDYKVTGVQTCALPIFLREERALLPGERPEEGGAGDVVQAVEGAFGQQGGPVAGDGELEHPRQLPLALRQPGLDLRQRSEERRVGKECRARRSSCRETA